MERSTSSRTGSVRTRALISGPSAGTIQFGRPRPPAVLALEIELDRALAAVGRMKIGRANMAAVFAFDEGRAPAAGVIAGALAFHLDHVGAEIGQYLPRPGAGQDARQLQNSNASQRSRHCTISTWRGTEPRSKGAFSVARIRPFVYTRTNRKNGYAAIS